MTSGDLFYCTDLLWKITQLDDLPAGSYPKISCLGYIFPFVSQLGSEEPHLDTKESYRFRI